MIAASKDKDGKSVLVIGLSFANLDKFRKHPLDTFIRVNSEQLGLPVDIMLVSGKTEADMAGLIQDLIAPDTKVSIDPKLKQ